MTGRRPVRSYTKRQRKASRFVHSHRGDRAQYEQTRTPAGRAANLFHHTGGQVTRRKVRGQAPRGNAKRRPA